MDYLPFGLVVCDTNDLKKINDTEGHVAGDEYIKKSAKLLCDIFDHSPVFRVVGDEKRYSCNRNLQSRRQGNVQKQAEF